jgi:hypothetical protein
MIQKDAEKVVSSEESSFGEVLKWGEILELFFLFLRQSHYVAYVPQGNL